MPATVAKPADRSAPRPHRFAIGQKVRMRNTAGLSLRDEIVFKVVAKLPLRDGALQYKIRYEGETYERVTTEDNLEDVRG